MIFVVVGGELQRPAGQGRSGWGWPHHRAATCLEADRQLPHLAHAGGRHSFYGELSAGEAVLQVGQGLLEEGDQAGLGGGVKLFL